MALETLSSNEFSNFIVYDTISATPFGSHELSEASSVLLDNIVNYQEHDLAFDNNAMRTQKRLSSELENTGRRRTRNNLAVVAAAAQGRKKRKRKPRVCKNKEEAETQRMTHIVIERNRRKQMNEHLAVLRSLIPESYIRRGDQASIVGGAIDFVKELEQLLQALEARKLQLFQQQVAEETNEDAANYKLLMMRPPFAQFFVYPQYTWYQTPNKYTSKTKASIADIEVTLIETHANLRILTRKIPRQISNLVAGFQALYFTILHLNVTTMDPLVLYSINVKVEEGCQLHGSVDGIATAVHNLLERIEEEASLCW